MAEIKWNEKRTRNLIKIKHSDEVVNLFENAEKSPSKMQAAWSKVANLMGEEYTGKKVKEKYNNIFTKYKSERDKTSKTGSSSSTWTYWELFHTTFPKHIKIKMENVVDLGISQSSINDEVADLTDDINNKALAEKWMIKIFKKKNKKK